MTRNQKHEIINKILLAFQAEPTRILTGKEVEAFGVPRLLNHNIKSKYFIKKKYNVWIFNSENLESKSQEIALSQAHIDSCELKNLLDTIKHNQREIRRIVADTAYKLEISDEDIEGTLEGLGFKPMIDTYRILYSAKAKNTIAKLEYLVENKQLPPPELLKVVKQLPMASTKWALLS